MTSSFTSTAGIKFCDLDLGHMSLSGITMPEFIHGGEHLPGIDMTVFPGTTNGINAEIRTRLTLDKLNLQRDGYSADPDFCISGIHLGEAFGQVLPSHVVLLTSRRGEIEAPARVTDSVPPKNLFLPIHFGENPTNTLTSSTAYDPIAKIPEFKVGAVKIEKLIA